MAPALALCLASRWLSAASLLVTAAAFAAAVAFPPASSIAAAALALVLAVGAVQVYLAVRIEFDRVIFDTVRDAEGWKAFDAALVRLGWARAGTTGRTAEDRAAGLARLVRTSGVLFVAQLVLALVIMAPLPP
jgi:hypothetical protein